MNNFCPAIWTLTTHFHGNTKLSGHSLLVLCFDFAFDVLPTITEKSVANFVDLETIRTVIFDVIHSDRVHVWPVGKEFLVIVLFVRKAVPKSMDIVHDPHNVNVDQDFRGRIVRNASNILAVLMVIVCVLLNAFANAIGEECFVIKISTFVVLIDRV